VIFAVVDSLMMFDVGYGIRDARYVIRDMGVGRWALVNLIDLSMRCQEFLYLNYRFTPYALRSTVQYPTENQISKNTKSQIMTYPPCQASLTGRGVDSRLSWGETGWVNNNVHFIGFLLNCIISYLGCL